MAKSHAYTNDERDFIDVMRSENKHLGRMVQDKIEAGRDPRDIAILLEYAATKARGWCNGRYGR